MEDPVWEFLWGGGVDGDVWYLLICLECFRRLKVANVPCPCLNACTVTAGTCFVSYVECLLNTAGELKSGVRIGGGYTSGYSQY